MKVASGNVLWRQRKRNWCRTPFTFTVYTLTDRELSVKTGILNERFNLIKLFRIVDISVERTFLQRIFGMSTLVLDTRDQSSGNGVVALKNVINGFEVRQVLQEAVDAAGRQLHDIEVLQRQEGGLAALPERLRETAEARLEEPGASIVELGEMLGVSKSGVNHRLRKLHSLAAAAEKAEEKEGDCTI